MANFYYIKLGGTAATSSDAGRVATTRSTGSFAAKGVANYWDTLVDMLTATTPPAPGDYIFFSHLHLKTYLISTVYNFFPGVYMVSVDDANCDQYLKGAKEVVDNGGTTLTMIWDFLAADEGQFLSMAGLDFRSEHLLTTKDDGQYYWLDDCVLGIGTGGASNASWNIPDAGMNIRLLNTELVFSHLNQFIQIYRNSNIIMDRCFGSGTLVANLFSNNVVGQSGIVRNTDLSTIMAATSNFIGAQVISNDSIDWVIERCKLPTNMTLINGTPPYIGHRVKVVQSGSADDYYHFEMVERFVDSIQDRVTYLNATYDGVNGYSTKITTTDDINPFNPYKYLLATLPGQDLTVAKTVTVELTSDAGLTDQDISIELVTQDVTDQALGDVITSNTTTDKLAAGTNLVTAGTGTWTAGDTEDYIITKDIGAKAGITNSNVQVWVVMAIELTAANFDAPTIGLT